MRNNLLVKTFVLGPLATNCYLAYTSSSLKGALIDPACFDEEIEKFIAGHGIDVLYTINTHGHGDHIGGNASFKYPVLIHEKDEECLKDQKKNLSAFSGGYIPEVVAERTLTGGDVIKLDDVEMKIIHTPGHSPGGVSVLCGKVLFSGDTLFYEGVGRTDLPGGSYEDLMRSIKEKLFALPDDVRVLPGHGPETTIGHEKKNNPFL